jgi:hypothetical protein
MQASSSGISPDSGGSEPDETGGRLPESVVHEVLANDRRQLVLRCLDGPTTLRDLADRVAAESEGEDPSKSARQSVYVTLHQCHLPKLDDFGIVEYDDDRKTVEPAPGLESIRTYQERVRRRSARNRSAVSSRRIAALGLLGMLVVLPGMLGVAPFDPSPYAAAVFLAVVAYAGRAVLARRRGA